MSQLDRAWLVMFFFMVYLEMMESMAKAVGAGYDLL